MFYGAAPQSPAWKEQHAALRHWERRGGEGKPAEGCAEGPQPTPLGQQGLESTTNIFAEEKENILRHDEHQHAKH